MTVDELIAESMHDAIPGTHPVRTVDLGTAANLERLRAALRPAPKARPPLLPRGHRQR